MLQLWAVEKASPKELTDSSFQISLRVHVCVGFVKVLACNASACGGMHQRAMLQAEALW